MIYKHWLGTDALKLTTYPPGKFSWRFRIFAERILWRLLEPLIDQHSVVHPRLSKYLIKFGISDDKISIKMDKGNCDYCIKPCKKIKHEGINIAFYYPGDRGNRKFKRWVYGMDVIEELIRIFPKINWIHLDGTKDMCRIYPTLDAYIRPSRHDGMPRMILECQILNIPYYWDEKFNPSVGEVYTFVERVIK